MLSLRLPVCGRLWLPTLLFWLNKFLGMPMHVETGTADDNTRSQYPVVDSMYRFFRCKVYVGV